MVPLKSLQGYFFQFDKYFHLGKRPNHINFSSSTEQGENRYSIIRIKWLIEFLKVICK